MGSRRPARPRLYVVTAPASARGLYESWEACRAAVAGVAGARYQAVSSREAAEALLEGPGVRLAPGSYAFVDGNHLGGIGVVQVSQGPAGSVVESEIATTVHEVFGPAGLVGLPDRRAITAATERLRNVLAELGALYRALQVVPAGRPVTVVHDYEGVGAWMEGRWQTRDPLVREIVEACRAVAAARRLSLTFRHQRGHESTFAGPNDFAAFNGRADRLAARAALGAPPPPRGASPGERGRGSSGRAGRSPAGQEPEGQEPDPRVDHLAGPPQQ